MNQEEIRSQVRQIANDAGIFTDNAEMNKEREIVVEKITEKVLNLDTYRSVQETIIEDLKPIADEFNKSVVEPFNHSLSDEIEWLESKESAWLFNHIQNQDDSDLKRAVLDPNSYKNKTISDFAERFPQHFSENREKPKILYQVDRAIASVSHNLKKAQSSEIINDLSKNNQPFDISYGILTKDEFLQDSLLHHDPSLPEYPFSRAGSEIIAGRISQMCSHKAAYKPFIEDALSTSHKNREHLNDNTRETVSDRINTLKERIQRNEPVNFNGFNDEKLIKLMIAEEFPAKKEALGLSDSDVKRFRYIDERAQLTIISSGVSSKLSDTIKERTENASLSDIVLDNFKNLRKKIGLSRHPQNHSTPKPKDTNKIS